MNTFHFVTIKPFINSDEITVRLVANGEVLATRTERGNRASENRMEWAAGYFANIADWECVEAPEAL